MCRSVDVFGSHVCFVRCLTPFSNARPCHERRLRSTTNELECVCSFQRSFGNTPTPSRSQPSSPFRRRCRWFVPSPRRRFFVLNHPRFRRTLLLWNSMLALGRMQPTNPRDVLHGIPALRAWKSVPRFQPTLSPQHFLQCRRTPDDRIWAQASHYPQGVLPTLQVEDCPAFVVSSSSHSTFARRTECGRFDWTRKYRCLYLADTGSCFPESSVASRPPWSAAYPFMCSRKRRDARLVPYIARLIATCIPLLLHRAADTSQSAPPCQNATLMS